MKTSDFDYYLPKELIAQKPIVPRDRSRLMVYDTRTDSVEHRSFSELGEFVGAGDVLVVNSSKVVPARIVFECDGREVEIFLLKKLADGFYCVLVRPGKKFDEGVRMRIDDELCVHVHRVDCDGTRVVRFDCSCDLESKLRALGRVPLPPYIDNPDIDFSSYQTVYAGEEGSVAAPTAGLHFTEDLIKNLKRHGVLFEEVVLHVGRGTFIPVATENIEEHLMHEEFYRIDDATARRLNEAKNCEQRIVAVGTTTVRVLESNFDDGFHSYCGSTDIFITPGGHQWKVVDALITNFHLPKSTLIMLVASFLECKGVADPVDKVMSLYEMAKGRGYRFYSFGDAMMLY